VIKMHSHGGALDVSRAAYWNSVSRLLNEMLREDLGTGDITTELFTKAEDRKITARVVSKCNAVVAGMSELKKFFSVKNVFLKGRINFTPLKNDSDRIKRGAVLATVSGFSSDVLKTERVILNFLQRMSGVATLTAKYKKMVPSNVLITPTRKSLWGMVDKKACLMGGGGTHRINLSDAILVKDNHVALASHNFNKIFDLLEHSAQTGRFIEIEVKSRAEAFKVIELYKKNAERKKTIRPLFIMLDNFPARKIGEIIKTVRPDPVYGRIFFEASGGINLKNIKAYAKTGVDIISIGALTHSAPSADFSMTYLATSAAK